MGPLFLLRWSLRDLRRRWLQVAAIALVIAIGTGVYSGLGSTARWRRQSNDASFEVTGMYDLRVRAAEGADAPEGTMLGVLAALPDRSVVTEAEERLVMPTQVDASIRGETILVPGRIIGLDVAAGGPDVTKVFVEDGHGRTLQARDAGDPVVVLERNFARFYDLAHEGELRLAGGHTVGYVGRGLAPEYFFVITEQGAFFAEANFAAVFTSLPTAQALTGRPGRVNDLVLRLRPGTDVAAARTAVEKAFGASGLGLGATVMLRADEDAYRLLYDDIEGDQKIWNVFAGLILAGAAFGAFNLTSRMVEAQRREIGIGMALGARPVELAARPLLVGVEIAVLGVAFGIGMGLLVIAALRPALTSFFPLPVWRTEFQTAAFARGAVLGLVIPVVATAWPVWRAVRVAPVEAIATMHRSARGGLSHLLRRMSWPKSAFRRMPLGNVLRMPRRTLLTSLGIGAAIAALVAMIGMIDSLLATVDRGEGELLQGNPDRVVAGLDGFLDGGDPRVQAIQQAASVGAADPVLRLGGRLSKDGLEGGEPEETVVEVLIDILDLRSGVWAPTVVEGSLPLSRPGVVLSQEAARDLRVAVGDSVVLEHPAVGPTGLERRHSRVRVAGLHPNPFRFNLYLDRSQSEAFAPQGLTNQLHIVPAAGASPDDVEKELFGLDGVTSVQPVAASSKVLQDSLEEFAAVFQALQGFLLVLALLIAYNATSINADERAREHATLFAFGLPLRRIVALDAAEGALLGMLGTAVGVAGGLVMLAWVTQTVIAATLPELGMVVSLSASTVATAVVLGVGVVAVAPLFTVRRMRRMDIPGALRVVE